MSKVVEFLDTLDPAVGSRANRSLDLLKEFGPALRAPDSKMVARGLFELRVVGAIQIRFLYFFHKGTAVVVHALVKKQNALNRGDIAYAMRIRKKYIDCI